MHFKMKTVILTVIEKMDLERVRTNMGDTKKTINAKHTKSRINTANMGSKVGIGIQDFAKLREKKGFYVDKTLFLYRKVRFLGDKKITRVYRTYVR